MNQDTIPSQLAPVTIPSALGPIGGRTRSAQPRAFSPTLKWLVGVVAAALLVYLAR